MLSPKKPLLNNGDALVGISETEEKKSGGKPRPFGLGRLLRQAGPEKCMLAFGTVALFLAAIFTLALPAFVGTIIDAISVPNPETSPTVGQLTRILLDLGLAWDQRSLLTASVVGLVVSVVIGAIFSFIRGYIFNLAGERVVARLRKRLFEAIVSQEIAFFDTTRTGELTNRLAADTTLLKDACTTNISMGLRWGSTVLGGLIYLFFISVKLTGVMLAVVPLVVISGWLFGSRIRGLSKRTQDQLAMATMVAEESISNIRDVRAFSKELFQLEMYGEKIQETYRLGARMAFLYGAFIAFIGLLGSGSIMIVLWYGATLVLNGELSTGVLTSYVLYSLTVAASLAGLSGLMGDLWKAVGANERVFQLIDRVPNINIVGGQTIPDFQGLVQLKNVTFSYPARPDVEVLHDVTLDLKPGTVTALVGPSGGGKSTVVALIERFYDVEPSKGQVLVDGRDVRELDPAWLHRVVGLVKQEPVLFATTIKKNLMYGVETCTHEEVVQAAQVASAHDFIEDFPEKYETVVGERGVRLSGGQKQRVAIARAVLMNPRILIADEATSSLDAESEHKVQIALDLLMKGRTVLMIAHRLSTVKNAHNVVVVEGGRIVEQGTHAELLAKDGSYARLVRRQLTNSDELEFD